MFYGRCNTPVKVDISIRNNSQGAGNQQSSDILSSVTHSLLHMSLLLPLSYLPIPCLSHPFFCLPSPENHTPIFAVVLLGTSWFHGVSMVAYPSICCFLVWLNDMPISTFCLQNIPDTVFSSYLFISQLISKRDIEHERTIALCVTISLVAHFTIRAIVSIPQMATGKISELYNFRFKFMGSYVFLRISLSFPNAAQVNAILLRSFCFSFP